MAEYLKASRHLFERRHGTRRRWWTHPEYREHERTDLEEGISEAGAIASWTADAQATAPRAGDASSVLHILNPARLQRVGDQIWAAADQRARALLGATQDEPRFGARGCRPRTAPSPERRNPSPTAKAYDRSFAGRDGRESSTPVSRLLVEEQDVFYYVT